MLQDKIVIVTGGTGVLGDAFTRAIAKAGAVVGILGRRAAVAESRSQAIRKAGGRAEALVADVLDEKALKKAGELMLEKYGKLDGLVNAAGGNQPGAVVQPGADIFDLDIDALRNVMNHNLFGTLLPVQVFGPLLASGEGKGSIVNISSVSAQKALTRVLGYSLAKSGIESYTRWFATELAARYGDKIRMNAVVPGFFLTDQNRALLTEPDGAYTARGNSVITQTPFKRFGHPDELTGVLIWLLSDASSFVTGTSIPVDGGFLSYSGV